MTIKRVLLVATGKYGVFLSLGVYINNNNDNNNNNNNDNNNNDINNRM